MIKVKNQLTWLKIMLVCIDVLTSDKYNAGAKRNVKKELMRLAKEVDAINGKTIIKNVESGVSIDNGQHYNLTD